MDCTWNHHFREYLAVFVMLSVQTGMACQMDEIALEMHNSGQIKCHHNFPPGSFHLVTWTKSSNGECYKNGVQSLASWDGSYQTIDRKYGIDPDFSLVIHRVTQDEAGIYRCTVLPTSNGSIFESDFRLSVYKQPDNPPSMHYFIQDDNIEIKCSVGSVFPLKYPEFQLPPQNNNTVINHAVLNHDGTYMVVISALFSYDGMDNTWECSYSSRNQLWTSFLSMHQIRSGYVDVPLYTNEVPNTGTREQNTTLSLQRSSESGTIVLGILLANAVIFITAFTVNMFLRYYRKKRRKSPRKAHRKAEQNGISMPNGHPPLREEIDPLEDI